MNRRLASMSSIIGLAAGVLLGAAAAGAPVARGADERTRAIVGVTVIDVTAGRAVPGQTVLIEGDRIAAVGPAGEVAVPEGAQRIEGAGRFLMPGLFDAHVHTVDPDSYGPLFVANGVTFVRDLGAFTDTILTVRDDWNRGARTGPRMIATGAIIDGDPPVWPFSEACKTPEDGRAAVNKLADAGVDQIKVYSNLPKDVYLAIVEEGHRRGLKVVGHVPDAVPFAEAVAAGQDDAEHLIGFEELIAKLTGYQPDPEQGRLGRFLAWGKYPDADPAALRRELARVKDAGMVICPTLVVLDRIGRLDEPELPKDSRLSYVPAFIKQFWESERLDEFKGLGAIFPHMKSMVGELHRAGVTLLAGTDVSNPYLVAGFSLHEELALMQQAGVPPAAVLRSATTAPAGFFGVADRLGAVEEGKLASLLLLGANPLEDVRNTQKIEAVFHHGRHHDRAELDAMLARVRKVASGEGGGASAAALSLPGTELFRGRYTYTFNGNPAGTEDFLITRTDDGAHHVIAASEPLGGIMAPSRTTIHTDAELRFRSAEHRIRSATPVLATYVRAGGRLTAVAFVGGEEKPAQQLEVAPDALVSSTAVSQVALHLRGLDLAPGESRESQAVSFGYPGWQMQSAPQKVTRLPDEALARPDGTEVTARRYAFEVTTAMGKLTSDVWAREDGLVLRLVNSTPFGKVEAVLTEGGGAAATEKPAAETPARTGPPLRKGRAKLY